MRTEPTEDQDQDQDQAHRDRDRDRADSPSQPSPEVALLKTLYAAGLQELAATPHGLAEFGEFVFGLVPAAHHKIWLNLLEDKGFRRVIIIAPPGHAKSTWCSVIYPTWRIGLDPSLHYLGTSITATQAQLFSVATRDTIAGSPRFKTIFPNIQQDKSKGWGESEWFVKRGNVGDPHATYAASGVGGAVIGRRADEIGLDDPYDEKNTSTELQRKKILVWLKRTLRSRLVPGGRFRGVLTRWHFDDFVKEFEGRPTYTVARMKALSEDSNVYAEIKFAKGDLEAAIRAFGDRLEWMDETNRRARVLIHQNGPALWPEYWSESALRAEREDIGIPLFDCMFQGDPSALSGKIFSVDCFQDLRPEANLVKVAQFWDTALSSRERSSFTVGATGGIDSKGNLHILRIRRKHLNSLEHRRAIEEAWAEDREDWPQLDVIGIEEGLLSDRLIKELALETNLPIKESLPRGDKVSRARPVAAKGEAGKLFVDRKASWWPMFLSEFLAFDRGRWDDQVDAVSGLYSTLFAAQHRWRKTKFLSV